MTPEPPVTHWLELLKAGNRDAAGPLWQHYFRLLVSQARARLGSAPRRAADEEDVALSAFSSFCRGVERGSFPQLDDRDDLKTLLLRLIARKAAHMVRDECAARRGGGKVIPEADLACDEDGTAALAAVLDSEPTPQMALVMAEECKRLLECLGDEELRRIVLWQVEGDTV
jgi:hypothetical protein